jgi:hypothetical protein
MRERADRRFAVLLGIVLALMAFTNDVLLTPPEFLERGVASAIDEIKGRPPEPADRRSERPSTVPTTQPGQ